METTTMVLGGLVISVGSFAVSKVFGNNRVKDVTCGERREACTALLSQKIDSLAEDVKEIKEIVNKTVQ